MVSLIHSQLMNHLTLKCITVLVFLMIPVSISLSFNFTPGNGDVIYQGSARLSNNSIQLTSSTAVRRAGWATYAQPLRLWDRSSGNVTDFTTNFSFVIDSFNSTVYGDGFTFFLTPNGSRFQENSTSGSLGLTGLLWNSTDIHLVAVEFDINSNEVVDPPYEHVGIDVDGVSSVADVRWWSTNSIMEGREQEAWISYDSQSRNLSVVFTGYVNRTSIKQSLSRIVDLRDHLPEFVTIGFSASTGGAAASQNIYSWSFSSNLEVKSGPGTVTVGVNSGNSNTKLVIGLVVGGSILVLALGLLIYCLWKKRKGIMNRVDKTPVSIGEEFEQSYGPKKFAYNDLKEATNNFATQDKLGEGGFGSVYKGYLKANDSYVAVKRISSGSKQGIKEFAREVKTISTLRHRNLVQLLGWCYEKNELLVYDFMPNGSLDFHLFKGRSLLKWGTRFRIARGLAPALLYLHEEWEQYVLHRDIKSSNIMLDANFNVKLGDFGLAKLVDHEKRCDTTVPAGTWGYMAPEYVLTGKASKETDVFSFGVVALEIASGRKSRQFKIDGDDMDLVEWVWSLYSTEKLLDAADHRLNSDFTIREIEQLLGVGLWCTQLDKRLRPSIRQAIRVLNFEAPLPALSVPLDILSLSSETNVSTSN